MKPFNLEAARAGKPIVTSWGWPVRFLAYEPEADENSRLVVFVEGIDPIKGYVALRRSDGTIDGSSAGKLFMKDMPKEADLVQSLSNPDYFYESEEDLLEEIMSNMDGDEETHTIIRYKRLPDRKATITRLWSGKLVADWWGE